MKKLLLAVLVLVLVYMTGSVRVAIGNDGALLQEIRELREEVAELKKDTQHILDLMEIIIDPDSLMYTTAASNIISDLRRLKAASIIFYADYFLDEVQSNIAFDTKYLLQYFDNPSKFTSEYYISTTMVVEGAEQWWLGYDLKKAGKNEGVKEKLKNKAELNGIYGDLNVDVIYTDQDIAWMQAR